MNLDNYVLSLSNILDRVDEYELYCHYLGFEPDIRETYSSPIRDDDTVPSFSFYNARPGPEPVEFMWKDNALNKSGTIVHLVMELYKLDYTGALKQIDVDFNLGFTKGEYIPKPRIITHRPKMKQQATIAINSKYSFSEAGRQFWSEFGISEDTLKLYQVTELQSAVINGTPVLFKGLTFGYHIAGRYKIYSPHNKRFKFINNYDEKFVEGFHQLPKKSDTLIITKSLKDVMVLHEFGYEAISPRSETTMIPEPYFKWIDSNYSRVVILFDNDMKHNGDKYPYPKVYIPTDSGCKDISDYVKKYSKEDAECILKKILK